MIKNRLNEKPGECSINGLTVKIQTGLIEKISDTEILT